MSSPINRKNFSSLLYDCSGNLWFIASNTKGASRIIEEARGAFTSGKQRAMTQLNLVAGLQELRKLFVSRKWKISVSAM
jgi:hypothetical protein